MKIKSDFALLDVKEGQAKLFAHFVTDRVNNQNPEAIPVVIYGEIVESWGGDDGISREFEVSVKSVNIDYTGQAIEEKET